MARFDADFGSPAIQITSGLDEGDLVIISGVQLLRAGLEIELEKPVGADDPVS